MNGSKPADLLFNKNGQAENPISLDVFLIITKITCSFIGIPLNVFLAIIIIRFRRLHSKPRNIFLLGIVLSNIITFIPPLIELSYWIVPVESICKAYNAVLGLPYAILLQNTLFALGDRYVAITYPLWHFKTVTVSFANCFLVLSTLILIFLLKFVYIAGIIPLRCEIWHLHGKVIGWTMVILLVFCITIHFIVFRKTRNLLRGSRHITRPTRCRNLKGRRLVQVEILKMNYIIAALAISNAPNECSNAILSGVYNQRSNPHQLIELDTNIDIHVTSGVLKQMEMEATRTLITGVASLFLMTCPLILFFLSLSFCRLITQSECYSMSWLAPYFKELGLVHAVYNPLIFLVRNNELRTVFKDKIRINVPHKVT